MRTPDAVLEAVRGAFSQILGGARPALYWVPDSTRLRCPAALMARGIPPERVAHSAPEAAELTNFRLDADGMLYADFKSAYIRACVEAIAEAGFDAPPLGEPGDAHFFERALLLRAKARLIGPARCAACDADAVRAVQYRYGFARIRSADVAPLADRIERRLDAGLDAESARRDAAAAALCAALAAALEQFSFCSNEGEETR